MLDIKVLDGSFSAQLSQHITEEIDHHPLWTSRFLKSNPDAVYQAHLDYLRAGSDIIETGTYQASIPGFAKHLNLNEMESIDLIKQAVALAKQAITAYRLESPEEDKKREILIAGSCGPYGAILHDGSEYTGNYANSSITKDILKDFHRPKIQALLDANVDLLALETIPCAIEAEALIELLQEFPDAKAWISFSCRQDGKSLADGNDFAETALKCYKAPVIAIGVNCINPKCVEPLLERINGGKEEEDRVPLIAYPNSGEMYDGHVWIEDGVKLSLNSFVHRWLDLGVKLIGSCCRTNSKDIEGIKAKVIEWQEQRKTGRSL